MTRLRLWAGVCAIAAIAGLVAAHVRLRNPANGALLRWSTPSAVSIVVSSTGSDDIADDSETSAVRLAVREWNRADGSALRLVENAAPAVRARADWESDDLHLVWFDEQNSSEWFTGSSGTVAITPVWFNSAGVIVDADVLFNGRDWRFTTSRESGRFDVQDVATHELGHLLGLDHSPHDGASMYPYVDPAVLLHRSLSADDVAGARHIAPSAAWGSVSGVLERASGGALVGAHVVARTLDGHPRAATLSDAGGAWTLRGLAAGEYEIYCTPLDAAVGPGNLTTFDGVQTDFGARVLGRVLVPDGGAAAFGAAAAAPDHGTSLGRASDDLPLRLVRGGTRNATLRGSGLAPGSTLRASASEVALSGVVWSYSQVAFTATVAADAAFDHVDLEVVDPSGALAVATGVFELTPADPVVASVEPPHASPSGGSSVLVRGSGFRHGVVLVAGPHIYEEGAGLEVLDASTLRFTTREDAAGVRDVVVIDPSGVEGRLAGGLRIEAVPSIQLVFPAAGSAEGGTLVHVTGVDFEAGSTVAIDGVVQDEVVQIDARTLRFRTRGGLSGAPAVLEVVAPTQGSASTAFMYLARADPSLASISPASGPAAGGGEVELVGDGLPELYEVVFGADPRTGLGGSAALVSNRLDSRTLRAVVPAGTPGAATVLVRDLADGSVAVAEAAYTYFGPDEGPAGGGCTVAGVPSDPWSGAAGFAPILLAALFFQLRARRALVAASRGR